jgi:glycerol-3-phosphate dehydrogenase (NAD(P)+)
MEASDSTDGAIAVLNAGGWGTALAVMLARAGRSVTLWARRAEAAERLRAERENATYLPGIPIPAGVQITADLGEAILGRGVVIMVAISGHLRVLARQVAPLVRPDVLVVHGTKGFEPGTRLRCSEVIEAELGSGFAGRVAVLSGPTHAEEVGRGVPTAS